LSNGPRSTDPQWAPDPTGLHTFRFWDGDQWTDDVSDDGVPPAYLPDAGPPPPPPAPTAAPAAPVAAEHGTRAELSALRRQQERTHTKRWFWIGTLVGACAVAAGIAVAVFVFNANIHRPSTTKRATVKTTTTQKPTTTTTANPGRPLAQVHLDILNGSGVAKAAGTKALQLAALGYQIASVGNATDRQGTVAACKPGLDLEAATLAKNVAPGTTVIAFPTPAPAGSASADCVVLLGH
jgi:hypothetical protein